MFDHGIDGEVEFKDNDGKASGKRIYIQLKSGNSYLRTRKSDGSEVFDVKDDRHLECWVSQPVDVYVVIRQTDELSGQQVIRWMNVTRYLKSRKDKKSRQIIFDGEKLRRPVRFPSSLSRRSMVPAISTGSPLGSRRRCRRDSTCTSTGLRRESGCSASCQRMRSSSTVAR